jgi:hypothetical protein
MYSLWVVCIFIMQRSDVTRLVVPPNATTKLIKFPLSNLINIWGRCTKIWMWIIFSLNQNRYEYNEIINMSYNG